MSFAEFGRPEFHNDRVAQPVAAVTQGAQSANQRFVEIRAVTSRFMHPLREGYYGYKLVKALAVTGITLAILLADCLSGFQKIDQFGRWTCLIVGSLGALASVYYWRRLDGRKRQRHPHTHRHSEPEVTRRNPPAVLPPRRE